MGGKLTYLKGSGMLPRGAEAQPEDGTIEAVGMVAESMFLAEKGIAKSLDGHLTCFRKRRPTVLAHSWLEGEQIEIGLEI